MDDLHGAEQPQCPTCGVVMRDEADWFVCPSCGFLIRLDPVEMPPSFDGPTIRGG